MHYLLFIAVLFVGSTTARDPDCDKHQYWPDVHDCSKYLECNPKGEKIEMSCPAGLWWNPLLTTCDNPENVDCKPVPNKSLGCTEGEYFPDTSNCQAFYECINGAKQRQLCPDPLLWNVHLPGCTTSSDCSQVVPTPTTCTEGDLTGDVDDCHRFFICKNDKWVGPLQCPNDLYWSEKAKGCVDIKDSDCQK
ncbi:peritrophin-48-like isoform X3 [Diabrotica virgifera virgifera]|uniref:Chitin-binding type-2 domain-containing protein n=1 Tax=Diabrotica virgifera virgifera TaxID=50390 RepID=A0ABM5K4K5_DIAVI|nr:peritrophin-48-like isoform X3 [Diabrotica virgifera virgifera]